MNLGNITKGGLLVGILFFGVVGFAYTSHAQLAPCTFTGNLEVGTINDSVRCIQKFLNENGFTITTSGGGAPGHETTTYGVKTKEAVKKWQAANGISTTGTFGPVSQAEYLKKIAAALTSQVSSLSNSSSNSSSNTQVDTPVVSTDVQEKTARDALSEAHNLIEKTKHDLKSANSSNVNITSANADVASADDDLATGLIAFIEENYSRALSRAQDITDSMNNIQSDIHGDSTDADQALADARSSINDAQDEITQALHNNRHVDQARDILSQATKKLNDAKRKYNSQNYDDTVTLARQAENLADDAINAIGN